jgi:hypothetical protein
VGDLVRLRNEVFSSYPLGLVTKVLSESMVVVLWVGTEFEYMESIDSLEVLNG